VAPLLDVSGMSAGYDGHPFVHDINLYVEAGEVVTLLGANGAGKTTTLLALSGDLTPLAGSVEFNGAKKKMPLYRMAQRGLAFVTEERSVFMRLSVAETSTGCSPFSRSSTRCSTAERETYPAASSRCSRSGVPWPARPSYC